MDTMEREMTIYDEDGWEELIEDDAISSAEAGFMQGFSNHRT